MIFDARRLLRRWITVTLLPKRVRKIASSIAESPPPTTTMCFSRKNAPSQVAQVDTPRPRSRARGPHPARAPPGRDDDAGGRVRVLGGPHDERPLPEIDVRDVDVVDD